MVTPLKDVSCVTMTPVEALSEYAIELAHADGQISLRRLHQQMIVIVHEAIGMNEPVISTMNVIQRQQECLSVFFIPVNGFTSIASGCHMIQRTCKLKPKRSSHMLFIASLFDCET